MGYIVRTRDYIYLDGIPLSDYGLAAEMPQPVPIAKPRYTVWTTGESDISEPDDSFEDVEYTFTVRCFKSPTDFRNPAFYAACVQAKTLTISRHSGRKYKIRRLIGITPAAAAHGNDITYNVTFALAPFAYHVLNDETDVTESRMIVNPGTRYSRPIYKLTIEKTAFDAVLSVNGQDCTISRSAASPLWIDCERMIAYNEARENQTQYTSGIFPFLSPGTNLLSCVTAAGQVINNGLTVVGNWRDY